LDYSHLKGVVDLHESIGELWLKVRVEYSMVLVIVISVIGVTFAKKYLMEHGY